MEPRCLERKMIHQMELGELSLKIVGYNLINQISSYVIFKCNICIY